MKNPGGYATIAGPLLPGQQEETDTFTCRHCSLIVHVQVKADPANVGGLCKQCMGLICPSCVGKGCAPIEKAIEAAEASYHARRSYGIV